MDIFFDKETCKSALIKFLGFPISGSDEIFSEFSVLEGARYVKGKKPNQRYLFIPGKKKNRVLLVAHTDTVWDGQYIKKSVSSDLKIVDDKIISASETAGIGADDRAGCAALWLLRESGHSLLLIDGEENSHIGASFIYHDKKMMKIINEHCFVLSFDLWGRDEYMFHAVSNPKAFEDFISSFGYKKSPLSGGSDIFYICRKAAGVNVSIGYKNEHKPSEQISINSFYECVNRASRMLRETYRHFKTPVPVRVYKFIKHKIALLIKPTMKSLKARRKK